LKRSNGSRQDLQRHCALHGVEPKRLTSSVSIDPQRGHERLKAYGIAPPNPSAVAECPRCGSMETEEVSRFGSTPCKAQWRCKSCLEPFDRFKCH